jgi:hypothetical protein
MATVKKPIMIQIDDLVREATIDEIDLIQAQQAENVVIETAREARKQSRLSALQKLGLTEEEINAIL